jgi:3-oxoacyl-[acyl-carrier protein] reductase
MTTRAEGSGRVALVTGATRGIARGIALDLARGGWAVAVSYRTAAAAAAVTRAGIEAAGARALVLQADPGDPEAARDLVTRVEAAWGRVDAVVHGAGPYHEAPLLEETPEGWREAFRQNLDPLLFLAQAAAPGMRVRRWGRILALGLATADRVSAQPNVTAYYTAKVGLLVLVRSLAHVLAADGVTVNLVSPGILETAGRARPDLEAVLRRIPAGHLGRIDDAVAAARFLLSDEAGYVTGASIPVSGGWGL